MGRPRKASASLAVDNADVVAPQGKKRGRPSTSRHTRGSGHVLTVGQGDTGQLGLGEDVMEKTRPGLVKDVKEAVEVVAGGMHTVVLDKEGKVWTFGCNDEG